jgi:putative DNA primase/helicase
VNDERDTSWIGSALEDEKRARKKLRPLRPVPPGADPALETIEGVKQLLLRSSNNAPRKIVANATTIFALDPRWIGVIAYQALSERVVKLKKPEWHVHDAPAASDLGPWTDADTTRAQAWLSREYGLDLGAETVNAAVHASAEQLVIDPLRDYFDRLRGTWDGAPRCDFWLSAIFNAPDTTYSRAVGSRWLISCVARALRPGCQVDHVLVLEGLQGKGKSTALRMLCPHEDLFFEGDLALGDKDAIQVLRGKWIIELGELGALNRHEIQLVKAFVTRRIDTYRPSFGRIARDFPRRFAFSGSTNEEEYLRDPTGNRRWWPAKANGPIDLAAIERHRDQLWAEALHRFEAGEVWYLETAELVALARNEQEQREEVDAWDERVGSYLARAIHDAPLSAVHTSACQCVRCHGVTTGSVLVGALGLEWGKVSPSETKRAGAILRGLGWVKGAQRRTDAGRVRPYFPPAAPGVLPSSEPSSE